MSDPRYPSAFQRPGGSRPGDGADPLPEPGGRSSGPAPGAPRPERRPPAVDVPAGSAPPPRTGNRIVLLGEDAPQPSSPRAPTRNAALGALYGLGAALLLLALLGGLWGQGLLRRIEYGGFGVGLNPDGLWEFEPTAVSDTAAGFARLLVQLAPTTLTLGVIAILAAIALPILTRRPR